MVRGVVVKINEQRGASTRALTGTVKREDTGDIIPFKTALSRVPNIGEGDWVSGTVRANTRMMTELTFAQGRIRSGISGRPKRQ